MYPEFAFRQGETGFQILDGKQGDKADLGTGQLKIEGSVFTAAQRYAKDFAGLHLAKSQLIPEGLLGMQSL